MSLTFHTSLGDIKVELFVGECPRTSFNLLALAASGYYDGLTFHRNIPGFMIQGGDPTSKGKGGESIWGGRFEDEIRGELKHDKRGVLSMANQGPNTNGSQFFFLYSAQNHLDGAYATFGQIIQGISVLDAMEKVPVGKKNRPMEPIIIKNITIHANPFANDIHSTLSN